MSLSSYELVNICPGLTYRKLDHWCRSGVFGDTKAELGSGMRRRFDDQDVIVAQALGRLSDAMDEWSGGRGGMISLYQRVAKQIREGERRPAVHLAAGVLLLVNLDEMEV